MSHWSRAPILATLKLVALILVTTAALILATACTTQPTWHEALSRVEEPADPYTAAAPIPQRQGETR